MYEQVEKTKENINRAAANSVAQKKRSVKQGFGFVDNREKNSLRKTNSGSRIGESVITRNIEEEGYQLFSKIQPDEHASRFMEGLGSRSIIQRRITSTVPALGPQTFTHRGRAGRHNTAANRAALAALRGDRIVNSNPAVRHVNNEDENIMGPAPGGAPVPLHMSHHISDHHVQAVIAGAANTHNSPAPAGAWIHVAALIAGINPVLAPVALPPAFLGPANAAYATAQAALAALMAMPALPHNPAIRMQLTTLANAITNSPMNLHHGRGQNNISIGGHGDPNSYPGPAVGFLNRSLTWRSFAMRNVVAPVIMDYRHLPVATAMMGTVAGAQGAVATAALPLGYAGPPIVHSSGAGADNFTPLQ